MKAFLLKNGAEMEPRGSPNGDKNNRISWIFRHPLPGALQGRVWGGFWDGFWEDFERVLDGFGRNLGGF